MHILEYAYYQGYIFFENAKPIYVSMNFHVGLYIETEYYKFEINVSTIAIKVKLSSLALNYMFFL